jgi:hypothetical protein
VMNDSSRVACAAIIHTAVNICQDDVDDRKIDTRCFKSCYVKTHQSRISLTHAMSKSHQATRRVGRRLKLK